MEFLARTLLMKLRFYGINTDFADLASGNLELVCLAAKTGISIIESTLNSADSYYIENVSFPCFVRRCNLEPYLPVGDNVFRRSVCFLSSRFPEFYYNCIAWPASIR